MWEWLKKQVRDLFVFFKNFWSSSPTSDTQNSVSGIDGGRRFAALFSSFTNALRKEPKYDLGGTKKLLQRNDLKSQFNYQELLSLIMQYRKALDTASIKESFTRNQISFLDLATFSAENALSILKCRFMYELTPVELAKIYYTHRHEKSIVSELLSQQPAIVGYPNGIHIPPLSYVLKKSLKKGTLKETWKIISESTTLLVIFFQKLSPEPQQRREPPHRASVVKLPDQDPYQVLGLDRDANEDQIKKAYRQKALLVHPDKGESIDGGRFKALSEAYQFLRDPQKRKAWDDAHPIKERPGMMPIL